MDGRAAELFAEIIADPTADDPRDVLADYLVEQGDPRGEFLERSLALARRDLAIDDRRAFARRVAELRGTHEVAWAREAAAITSSHDLAIELGFERGLVGKVTLDSPAATKYLAALRRVAPIVELDLTLVATAPIAPLVEQLVELSAIAIRGLDSADTAQTVRAIARWPHRGKLRALAIPAGPAAETVAGCANLAGLERLALPYAGDRDLELLAAAPHLAGLRALAIAKVGAARLGPLATWDLVELELGPGRLGAAGMRMIASVPRPRLRRLEVGGHAITSAGLPVFELPALEHLGLRANALRADACVALATNAQLANLVVLDLAHNPIGDAGVRALIDSPHLGGVRELLLASTACGERALDALATSAFGARLERLDLSSLGITDARLARLERGFDRLIELRLDDTELSPTAIARFVATPLARRLNKLAISGLSPGAATALVSGELPELRELVVDRLDDAGVAAMVANPQLPNLHDLHLFDSRVTDAGADRLAGTTRHDITRIRLESEAISLDGIKQLRARFGHRFAMW